MELNRIASLTGNGLIRTNVEEPSTDQETEIETAEMRLADARMYGNKNDYVAATREYLSLLNENYIGAISEVSTLLKNLKDNPAAIREVTDFCFKSGKTGQGSPASRYILGIIAKEGYGGVEQNFLTATYFFEIAAENGIAAAMFELGDTYSKTEGAEQNLDLAHKYYEQSGEKGLIKGFQASANLYFLEKDYSKAKEFFKKAADEGNVVAMCEVGNLYSFFEKDFELAHHYFELAGEKGYEQALLNNGRLYFAENNYPKTIECFTKAVRKGNTLALICLGLMYSRVNVAGKDLSKALTYFREAAKDEKQKIKAEGYILTMCLNGSAIEIDRDFALKFLKKSALAGNEAAKAKLAQLGCETVNDELTIKKARYI